MAKRPTRKQSILISESGLRPENWLVIKNPVGMLHIRHRKTGTLKVIKKPKALNEHKGGGR